jgi:hypothetical protein
MPPHDLSAGPHWQPTIPIPLLSHFLFLFFLACNLFLAVSGYAGGGVMPPHDLSAGPHWQPTLSLQ